MLRHVQAAVFVPACLMLAGCGEWTHRTKSVENFAYDDAGCRQESILKLQYVAQKEEAPKWAQRAVGSKTYTTDGNNALREQWRKACLQKLGWTMRTTMPNLGLGSADPRNGAQRYTAR